jgi:hypothetical protein
MARLPATLKSSSKGIRVPLLAAVALIVLGVTFAAVGCGSGSATTTAPMSADTIAAGATATTAAGSADQAPAMEASRGAGQPGLNVAAASLGRKVISNASLFIEVAAGKFQPAFDQARNLADQYGGYIVSSDATATDEAGVMRNGTVVVRVPSQSFDQALASASKLGDVKSLKIESQDVTEEYVDLQARLANAQTQEKALISLMGKAKTVDEVLQVQQVLTQTQQEIEQLKGRIKFLDEHSSYSTIAISLYESGAETQTEGGWGFVAALEDALHAFVGSVNDIVVSLGGALPVLALLALLAWIAYRIARPIIQRSRQRRDAEAARYRYAQPQPRPYPEAVQPQPRPYEDGGAPVEPPAPEDGQV